MTLREKYAAEIAAIRSRYAHRRSAVLPLLYIAQDEYGYLPDSAIREVAELLELPPTDIFEVVGFYTLFHHKPVGKWVLQVCDDVPCCYCGAEELIEALKHALGIGEEETTADGMFTLQRVKCLAACDRAPVLQANLSYIYRVRPEHVDGLLRDLRERAREGKVFPLSGCSAEDYTLSPSGALRPIPSPITATPISAIRPVHQEEVLPAAGGENGTESQQTPPRHPESHDANE